ncbi:MAG: hypothetical protein ABI408_02965, partial [Gemmatimonadaceae bacterium]
MRICLPVVLVVSLGSLAACSKEAATTSDSTAAVTTTASTTTTATPPASASAAPTTADDKIKNAMSAAPDSISSAATIMDFASTPNGAPTQLRAGTNGWVCFPSTPRAQGAVGEDPMCLDAEFQKWAA